MRSPWFRIVGPAALCLALLPPGAPGDTPKAKASLAPTKKTNFQRKAT